MPTILVVEDDPDLRELMRHILGDDGHDVVTAANGREALDLLEGGRLEPCVILLDLMMPVLSGPEMLEIMSEDRRLSSLPVVVVSAMSEGSAPGVRCFLRKPVAPDVLRAVVAEHCRR